MTDLPANLPGDLPTPNLPTSKQTLPPWRQPLARALHRNRSQPFARYFQLATLRSNGRPANRTVVFRGFVDPDTTEPDITPQASPPQASPPQTKMPSLKLVTDQRSEKIAQLAQSAWAEACWYFPKTREQFRLAGKLHILPPDDPLHLHSWQALSTTAQSQFAWPQPGAPRADAAAFQTSADPATPPPTFAVLLLAPNWVDHLELRGDPQQRHQYTYTDNQWTLQTVNP